MLVKMRKRYKIGIACAVAACLLPVLPVVVPSQDLKTETYRVELLHALHNEVICKIYGFWSQECEDRMNSTPSNHALMRCLFAGHTEQMCTEEVVGPSEKRKDW
jgi:hypothetical protein